MLGDQVIGHQVGQRAEQRVEQLGFRRGECSQRWKVLHALTFDEIGGQRPRRTAKPEQCRCRRELRTHERECGRDLRRDLLIGRVQPVEVVAASYRLGDDGSRIEVELDADRSQRAHDVGKDDRGIEWKPPDRHQRDLGRELGVASKVLEAMGLAETTILREVASGLAHDPCRSSHGGSPGYGF
jgi:hypothetical protein